MILIETRREISCCGGQRKLGVTYSYSAAGPHTDSSHPLDDHIQLSVFVLPPVPAVLCAIHCRVLWALRWSQQTRNRKTWWDSARIHSCCLVPGRDSDEQAQAGGKQWRIIAKIIVIFRSEGALTLGGRIELPFSDKTGRIRRRVHCCIALAGLQLYLQII